MAVSVGNGVDVSGAGVAVNVSVGGRLVDVECAVDVGGTADVTSCPFPDGRHEKVSRSNRMNRYPDLNFISPLYPAHHGKRAEETCGVVPNKAQELWLTARLNDIAGQGIPFRTSWPAIQNSNKSSISAFYFFLALLVFLFSDECLQKIDGGCLALRAVDIFQHVDRLFEGFIHIGAGGE